MLKKLGPYARPYSKWIAVGVLCSAAEAIFELLIPLVMADIVNIGIETANQNYILQKGLLMMGMAVISLCFGLGAAASSSVAGQGFGAELRRAEYEHIQNFAFSNIEKFSTASLVTRLTNDVNNMQMTLMMGMRLLVRAPVMLVAALVLSIRLSRDLSNVFLVVIPLLLIVIVLILTKAGPLFRSLQERTDALNLVVQENLTGIRVVKSFVREDYEEEKFAKRNGDLKESSMRAFGMVVINMPVMMLVVYSTIIAVMWFGGKMVYAGTLPVGDLTAFFTYITQILMSLMMVSMMFMMMTRSIACAKRIVEVLDERPAITDDSAKADAAVKDGSIDFDHVFFKYSETSPEWDAEGCEHPHSQRGYGGHFGGHRQRQDQPHEPDPPAVRGARRHRLRRRTAGGGLHHGAFAGVRQRGVAKEHPVLRYHPGKSALGRSQRHGGPALGRLPRCLCR